MSKNLKIKFFIAILLFNVYLVSSLFFGKNTITNYIKYTNEVAELNQHRHNLVQQRYQLRQTMALLDRNDPDASDVLEEMLRQTLKVSLQEEKIVLP